MVFRRNPHTRNIISQHKIPHISAHQIHLQSYDALFRFGVPVFVMLSGAVFLPKERELNIKRLYTHNILRVAVSYVFWSALYGLMTTLKAAKMRSRS